ncbi:hypothetical protein VNO80_27487 [Phaseolus coccineus]|uniref:Uncharacterized protein n=1 Tax=Phaseolus coccineus TaxID=3886 RepID=A0AAN9LJR2_PHACN
MPMAVNILLICTLHLFSFNVYRKVETEWRCRTGFSVPHNNDSDENTKKITVLELAGNAVRDNKKTQIVLCFIQLTVRNNEELSKLYGDAVIALIFTIFCFQRRLVAHLRVLVLKMTLKYWDLIIVNIGHNTTVSDGDISMKLAQLFVVPHRQLNVMRHNLSLLVLSCGISS